MEGHVMGNCGDLGDVWDLILRAHYSGYPEKRGINLPASILFQASAKDPTGAFSRIFQRRHQAIFATLP